MKKVFLALTLTIGILACSYAQDSLSTKGEPFTFEASYIGEIINNLSGGIKTGSCYLGMVNIRFDLETKAAKLWQGGQFYVNAANTHGASPSAELLGDIQVASNIEAGNHTYFQEVWFKQTINKVEITAGLQDLNIEFANSDNAALFLNSSFGILPIISANIAAPIFPLTTPGITTKWNISDNAAWLNAIYDGRPTDFDYNPYNVKWKFNSGDGLLGISEFQYNTEIKGMTGRYKVGAFSHSHIIEKNFNKEFQDSLDHTIFGFYSYADQKLWKKRNKSLALFAQLGYSPSKTISNNYYLGFGFNFSGLISRQGDDILGLAVAYENFATGIKPEAAIELTYQYHFTKNIFIQPNFQYIINPSGTAEILKNCFTGNLRFGLNF